MRYFGYVYHGLLALFLLAISSMTLASGMHTLHLDMLPWTGASLTYWLFGGSLVGLLTVVLAAKRILPALFFLWSLVVFALMVKGYIFSGHFFDTGELSLALYLIAGALLSLLGSWWGMKLQPARA
jgi:hypothetical protein